MKRILIAVLGVLMAATAAEAQSNDQMIQRATAPLSGRAASGAAVIAFDAQGNYRTIREGSNAWVCYDRSSDAGRPPFAVQCTNTGNLDRLVQNRRFLAQSGGDSDRLAALVAAAAENGTRESAEFGSVWIAMNGQDMASASRHITVAVPMATAESLGFPSSGRGGGLWLMAGGTTEAHLMTPIS